MKVNPEQQNEHAEWSDAALDAEPVLSHRVQHRLGWALVAVLVATLLTVLPPLLNVSRYQRRVAQAISASIGRPVHFDGIHLHLLPLPGLTIQNFVVDEDPAFGNEPAMRANVVEARLRLASLWRRRVEVSHITLQAPSINLVRRADGRWNLHGVVTEAGYLQNAPTAQGRAGSNPRFPYIEATDARINIKAGENKLPWSLLDARLALWLPDQNEWRVRLSGRPLRTDTDVSDVGELQLEGSLGRGPGGVMNEPLTIAAHWASTPLGETTKLVLGHDTGFRGAASAELELHGTPAHMQVSSDLHFHNLRRSEFVPRLPMSVDAHCEADALGIVRALHNVRCALPTAESESLFKGVFRSREEHVAAAPGVLLLQADVPDLLTPATASVVVDMQDARPEYLLNWSRVLSSRIAEKLQVHGDFALHAEWNAPGRSLHYWTLEALCHCLVSPPYPTTSPEAASAAARGGGSLEPDPQPGQATPAQTAQPQSDAWVIQVTRVPVQTGPDSMVANSTDVHLSAARILSPPSRSAQPPFSEPSDPRTSIVGQISAQKIKLQYASSQLARYAAGLLPPLGDELPAGDPAFIGSNNAVAADRPWNGRQQWSVVPATSAPALRRRSHR